MRVRTISPRGYCYGVVDAMVLVRRVAANPDVPRPIHVLGMLVHNRQVTEAFEEIGVVCIDGKGKSRLELLEQVDPPSLQPANDLWNCLLTECDGASFAVCMNGPCENQKVMCRNDG